MQYIEIIVIGAIVGLAAAGLVGWSASKAKASRSLVLPLAIAGGLRVFILAAPVVIVMIGYAWYGTDPFGFWAMDEPGSLWKFKEYVIEASLLGLAAIPLEAFYVIYQRFKGIRLSAAWTPGLVGFGFLLLIVITDLGRFMPMV